MEELEWEAPMSCRTRESAGNKRRVANSFQLFFIGSMLCCVLLCSKSAATKDKNLRALLFSSRMHRKLFCAVCCSNLTHEKKPNKSHSPENLSADNCVGNITGSNLFLNLY
jgi:hypothetical protein